MAVLSFVPVVPVGNGAPNVLYSAAALTTGSTSGTIFAGNDQIIRIATTGTLTVRFGATGLATATAGDILLPGPGSWLFDVGHINTSLCLFNAGTASAAVTVNLISRN